MFARIHRPGLYGEIRRARCCVCGRTRAPALCFAYETACNKDPKFGRIKGVTKVGGNVRVQYETQRVAPFLSADDLLTMSSELDIEKWEMNRTHWAIKDVNLPRELMTHNTILPVWTRRTKKAVDVTTHVFDVALSFPGEARSFVEPIAMELEKEIGPNAYFYDSNFTSQLARPSLDTLLQDLYRNRSKLVVVFLSGDYEKKPWCGLEFRAIKEIIMESDFKKIMLVKLDDGPVTGIYKTDGYVDGRRYSPEEIAGFIEERIELLS